MLTSLCAAETSRPGEANSKIPSPHARVSAALQEFHLPQRRLAPVWFTFKPGERAFYQELIEEMGKARQELLTFRQQQQQLEGADPALGLLGSLEDGGVAAVAAAAVPTSPAAERTRKRQQAKLGERLELAAGESITQLRLACIHPQVCGRGLGQADKLGGDQSSGGGRV